MTAFLSYHWATFFFGLFSGILIGIRICRRHDRYVSRLIRIAFRAIQLRRADANHEPYKVFTALQSELFDLIDLYDYDRKRGKI